MRIRLSALGQTAPGGKQLEIEEIPEQRRAEFDAFVGAHIWGDVLQGWTWGEVKGAFGWRPHRFLLHEYGQIVGAVSVLRREVPLFGEILYAPRGPVLDPAKRGQWRELSRLLRRRFPRAIAFICEPRIDETAKRPPGFWRGRRRGLFQGIQPRIVAEIPLSGDLAQDFGRLHSKCRYNLRLSERRGVKTRTGEPPDRATFLRLLQITARRDGFGLRAPRFYSAVLRAFSDAGQGALLLAGRGEEDYAGVFAVRLGRHAIYLYGASDDATRRDMAAYACQWAAISWAANGGAERYDMTGMAPSSRQSHPLSGLRRFKMQWGAVERRYLGPLDVPLRLPLYLVYRVAEPIFARISLWRTRFVARPAQ
ncbi:MAG: peptidoglycan bridge formation glycyltransferase FemA/FemB family protein [Thermaerobacter sp.]|nr:peptidoglycan bridge formation glycyltransferase FemA/FemB family protein [Thermaerobacter sp.]